MTREKAQSAASPAATLVGLGAIALWSVLALLTASAGAIPPFELAALTFSVGGGLGLLYAAAHVVFPVVARRGSPREAWGFKMTLALFDPDVR